MPPAVQPLGDDFGSAQVVDEAGEAMSRGRTAMRSLSAQLSAWAFFMAMLSFAAAWLLYKITSRLRARYRRYVSERAALRARDLDLDLDRGRLRGVARPPSGADVALALEAGGRNDAADMDPEAD